LQAVSSRNMYSEQGLDALMRPLPGRYAIHDGGVVLHPGSASPGGMGDLSTIARLHGLEGFHAVRRISSSRHPSSRLRKLLVMRTV